MDTYNQANEVLNHAVAKTPVLIAASRPCWLRLMSATATAMTMI
jgi:hypothetical protein